VHAAAALDPYTTPPAGVAARIHAGGPCGLRGGFTGLSWPWNTRFLHQPPQARVSFKRFASQHLKVPRMETLPGHWHRTGR
jgi:hypothetical protein